jgi:succinate-semialdehyde dehydrogenase / glutarate-semialdehyde dehydrogenase
MVADLRTLNLIGGDWRGSSDGRAVAVRDPASDGIVAEVPRATSGDIMQAIGAASDALPAWSVYAAPDRRRILRRMIDLIESHAQDLASLVIPENSKPLTEARAKVAAST